MKICKQCGRELPVDSFRPYKARGRGVYNTTQGRNTICKECESMSSRAAAAIRKGDQEAIDKFTWYYKTLQSRGCEPVTAPAKKLLGFVDTQGRRAKSLNDAMDQILGASELHLHLQKLRDRSYTSFDEAEATHKALADQLHGAGLYDEAADLLEDWFLDD